MKNTSESIIASFSEWRILNPLSPEDDRRLWQKLRLEWNYHSNHIEGNTLTYGETELLLIHGQIHSFPNKPATPLTEAHQGGCFMYGSRRNGGGP